MPRSAALRVAVTSVAVAGMTLAACESRSPHADGAAGAPNVAAGGAPGAGGASGAGGAALGGGAGGEDLAGVARALDGFIFRLSCAAAAGERLCETSSERPCPRDADPALSGAKLVDETVTLGGDARALYEIELSVAGVVEAKNYAHGEDQSEASELPADGLYVGGEPGVGNAYNVYLLRVADPPRDYFLNSLATPDDPRLRRSVFPVRYSAPIRARGGTTVRLVLADPNCHATRNCADPDDGSCAPQSLEFLDDSWRKRVEGDPSTMEGQFLGLSVVGVRRALN